MRFLSAALFLIFASGLPAAAHWFEFEQHPFECEFADQFDMYHDQSRLSAQLTYLRIYGYPVESAQTHAIVHVPSNRMVGIQGGKDEETSQTIVELIDRLENSALPYSLERVAKISDATTGVVAYLSEIPQNIVACVKELN